MQVQGRSGSLISIRNYLRAEMCCKAKKYSEKTNPRQGGQWQGQDRNNNPPERSPCPTLFMNNVENSMFQLREAWKSSGDRARRNLNMNICKTSLEM